MNPFIEEYPVRPNKPSQPEPTSNAYVKFVETVLECSAKTIFNVDEAFDFATKAVLFPSQPLYDVQQQRFKQDAIVAFERIFRLCDSNYDGYWDNDELNRFQTKCYPAEGPLDPATIAELKNLIKGMFLCTLYPMQQPLKVSLRRAGSVRY